MKKKLKNNFNIKFLHKTCVACGSENFGETVKLTKTKIKMFNKYDQDYYNGALSTIFHKNDCHLLKCSKCNHIQYANKFSKNSLNKMYQAHYEVKVSKLKKSKSSIKELQHVSVNLLHRLYKITKKKNPDLLDFGAGAGLWSKAAISAGFNVTAYEPNSIRVDPKIQFVENWKDIENKKYDIIVCNQVLEHLSEPFLAVQQLLHVSHDKTLLYFSVPNVGKYSFKKITHDWPYNGTGNHIIAPFQHLNGFNMKSMIKLLNNNNLRVSVKAHLSLGIFGWSRIFAFWIGRYIPRFSTTTLIFKKAKK